MEELTKLVSNINSFIWGMYCLIPLLCGVGIYFTIRLKFIQVRKFGQAVRMLFGDLSLKGKRADKHGMSSFQSVATAIAAQVGTGNLAGAATAIAMGGPGAIFWMWIAAFFGMATIFAEAVLAQVYRTRDDAGHITHINIDSVSSISEEQVEDFAQTALSEGTRRGWVSDYRYRVVETDTGSTLVFVNGTMNRSMSGRLLLTAFLVLLGSAFLILALIIIISKRVVHPVAESYEKQKQFITDANHELKTPLTLILSNLDIVEADVGKNEWLDDIRSESERMGLLINQMVTLCRMDESDTPLALADVDLSGVVDDTVSEFQALAADRKKKLTASVEPGVHCRGDEALLRRLAAILMDNAVKYCDAGGEIRVSLRCRHHPVFTVENTYAEVDRLELDRLFDRFYRADKARTFTGSFGSGLSIAQSIAKKHKGSVTAYKKEGVIGFRAELKER